MINSFSLLSKSSRGVSSAGAAQPGEKREKETQDVKGRDVEGGRDKRRNRRKNGGGIKPLMPTSLLLPSLKTEETPLAKGKDVAKCMHANNNNKKENSGPFRKGGTPDGHKETDPSGVIGVLGRLGRRCVVLWSTDVQVQDPKCNSARHPSLLPHLPLRLRNPHQHVLVPHRHERSKRLHRALEISV